MIDTEEFTLRYSIKMNIPLLLCLLTYAPGIILNCTFLLCVKSPRTSLNAADLTIFIKTVQYIVVFSYLLVVEGLVWSNEVLDKKGERILTGISQILIDSLPVTTFILAIIRMSIFSNTGSSMRKVKRSTVVILYAGCIIAILICSMIVNISFDDREVDALQVRVNSSRKDRKGFQRLMFAHYFTVYIAPLIGSGLLYLFIVLKVRNYGLDLASHRESFSVQMQSKVSAIRVVARSLVGYMAMFILLWLPYVSCMIYKGLEGASYVVDSIEMALTGSILFWNPIADGMFHASRRKCLITYIRNSLHIGDQSSADNPQLSVIPLQDIQTHNEPSIQASCSSDFSQQPLYARRRGNVSTTPHISITNTPTQIFMLATPPMDNFHLSPQGSFELLSPIFYRREEGSPTRAMSFHTTHSGDCLIESISFRSSLLSMDQIPYSSSTPGSMQATSCQSNRRFSLLRCARSRSASLGNRIFRSSVAGRSYPGTSLSSHRSQK